MIYPWSINDFYNKIDRRTITGHHIVRNIMISIPAETTSQYLLFGMFKTWFQPVYDRFIGEILKNIKKSKKKKKTIFWHQKLGKKRKKLGKPRKTDWSFLILLPGLWTWSWKTFRNGCAGQHSEIEVLLPGGSRSKNFPEFLRIA